MVVSALTKASRFAPCFAMMSPSLLSANWCRCFGIEIQDNPARYAVDLLSRSESLIYFFATIVAFLQTYGSAQLLHQIPGMCRKKKCWACSNRASSRRLLDKCGRQRCDFLSWPRIHEQPSIRAEFESQSVGWVPVSPLFLQERIFVFDGFDNFPQINSAPWCQRVANWCSSPPFRIVSSSSILTPAFRFASTAWLEPGVTTGKATSNCWLTRS